MFTSLSYLDRCRWRSFFCLAWVVVIAMAFLSADRAYAIVAGASPDSPANRVDPNTTPTFGGVGSFEISSSIGTGICTGTAISERHVLTACHCFENSNFGTGIGDGRVLPFFFTGENKVKFHLNFGSDDSQVLFADAVAFHPDFTGSNNPNINDDIAIVFLANPIATGVPIYSLETDPVGAGTSFTLVGYGWSGTPSGYSDPPSLSVKRSGQNAADDFQVDDEGGGQNEIFRYDFDGPKGSGHFGAGSLGNDVETIIGPGDSGGPSFVFDGSVWKVAGVNTFTHFTRPFKKAPSFDSVGGGGGCWFLPMRIGLTV